MPSARTALKAEAEPMAGRFENDAAMRGAGALLRAAAGGGASVAQLLEHARLHDSAQARNRVKKAARLIRQGAEALDVRRYKAAEALFDEGLALVDAPPPLLWCYRLVAAAKADNYEYVVDNYQRIRALARRAEEAAVVDRIWIDCLVAGGFHEEALREAERLSASNAATAETVKPALGVIHARRGDLQKAIAIQRSVLERDPAHVLARWNLAIHQLEAGDLPEAFENYEARWQWSDFPSERRTFDMPRWAGENLQGKRILAWREQGVGDEIRFAGLLGDLVAAGAHVTFECSPKLLPLFRASFGDMEVRAEPAVADRRPRDYRGFDFEVPIGSLARHFRPTVAEMQARCRPWLKRDAEIESRLRADMRAAPHEPVVGLCWRSSNRNLQRNRNYVKGDYLAPLKLLGKSKFICLQYDECRDEVASMRELGLPVYDFSGIDQMNDLLSASYLAGACDLVVSAGTATAELSAGLGIPTVLFGPTGSQIQLGTGGVPWHPATRFLPLDENDPIGVAKSVLHDWKAISEWAGQATTSDRQTDWRLSFPGA